MAAKVDDGVLPFPARVVGRRSQDPCTTQPGLLVVAVDIVDTHHYGVRERDWSLARRQRGQDDGAIADVELRAGGSQFADAR